MEENRNKERNLCVEGRMIEIRGKEVRGTSSGRESEIWGESKRIWNTAIIFRKICNRNIMKGTP